MTDYCAACYCRKVYCRRCKGYHCQCSWNSKERCPYMKKPKESALLVVQRRMEEYEQALQSGDLETMNRINEQCKNAPTYGKVAKLLHGFKESLNDGMPVKGRYTRGVVEFVAIGRAVMQGSKHVATARSHTFARRIAEALNRHTPSRRGY